MSQIYIGHGFQGKIHSSVVSRNRETSTLTNDVPEESNHFRFLHDACLTHIKGSVGFILTKDSVMRIPIPLDMSTRSFIPLPHLQNKCHNMVIETMRSNNLIGSDHLCDSIYYNK